MNKLKFLIFCVFLVLFLKTSIYAQTDIDSTKIEYKLKGDQSDLELSLEELMNIKIKSRVIGIVTDKYSLQPIAGVKVSVEGMKLQTLSQVDGKFELELPTGSFNILASLENYISLTKYDVVVTSGNDVVINFELEERMKDLEEVFVTADRSVSVTTVETPNSINNLTSQEIKANPGATFDISRVVQSLPGVGTTQGTGGFRNDLIIRGGGPNENVFYLDGIEIPVLNHFSTEGSTGGLTGLINVSFIEDVTLASSSFHSRYDNTLSSVMQFKQRDGNAKRFQANLRMRTTESTLTLEGPIGKKTTFLISARRSYLQFTFALFDVPLRPNYWDFHAKVTHQFNAKTSLSFTGLGAIDEFAFEAPKKSEPSKEHILRSFPFIKQNNYTIGLVFKRSLENGYIQAVLSRNLLYNQIDRFEDNTQVNIKNLDSTMESTRTFGSNAYEIENKLRIEINKNTPLFKYSVGVVGQYVSYTNDLFARLSPELKNGMGTVIKPAYTLDMNSSIDFFKYGMFVNLSKTFFKNRLSVSAGVRTDMNTFTNTGNNPLNTLSPRLAMSFAVLENLFINGSIGRYYKILPYTLLGYKDTNDVFVNKDAAYTRCDHAVVGLEFLPTKSTRVTLEGFYKWYSDYPVSERFGYSLANQGGSFGVLGNEDISSIGTGRSYGMELLAQQKLWKKFFGLVTYTLLWSEFTDKNGTNFSSNWDTRHIVTFLMGKKFNKGWEIGLKYRFASGAPYTPYDTVASRQSYILTGNGTFDYSRTNTERTINFHQIDIRIDKKWNFKKWTLNVFVDVINVFRFANPSVKVYTFERTDDNSGFKTTDGQALKLDGSNAIPTYFKNETPIFVPSLGIIIEL